MRIKWTRRALANLEAELAHIAKDDLDAARLVAARIEESVARLEQQPGLGRAGRVPGTREVIVTRTHYIIPYRVKGRQIEILRVFHTARPWPDQL